MSNPNSRQTKPGITGHLEFYREKGISPVRQDLSDMGRHLARREALYRSMGLLPMTFRDRTVLEVAPGSGDNSLFVAACNPKVFDLLEPNPVAIDDIETLYRSFDTPHRNPKVIPEKLEDFQPEAAYDVILCEGWLGGSDKERQLLGKLSGFVAPEGALVISFLPVVGAVPTMLRRLLAYRILSADADFETQTGILTAAFGTHLDTMPKMSRAHASWVQDNILNPAVLAQVLLPKTVFETLGDDFTIYGSNPRLFTDWRWYKSVSGEAHEENALFLEAFEGSAHNFLDYRIAHPPRDAEANRVLEAASLALYEAVPEAEGEGTDTYEKRIAPHLRVIIENLADIAPETVKGLEEAQALLERETLGVGDIAEASLFAGLFGREMCYLTLTRRA
ncbi:MAG: class I SAM-dependent methyltransferase [Rhodospirillales bacterium]|nr:class I SAM-dependent methyltransferase [Rhodospirillales bacterium]